MFLDKWLVLFLASCLLSFGCPSKNDTSDTDGGDTDESDADTDTDVETVLYPQDGSWSGSNITFTVSGGGTEIAISHAEYGSCSNGGCSASGSADCGDSCSTTIDNEPGEAGFDEGTIGCSGTFDSTTTASGTCSSYDDGCGCSMSESWTASL